MKKVIKRSFWTYLVLILIFTESLYSQITIQLQQPPPFQFKVEHLWRANINNPGQAVNVYLFGTIERGSRRLLDATTSVFLLPTGLTRVNAKEISPIDVEKYSNEVEETLNKTGTLQSGTYNICLYVMDANTKQALGSFCNDYEILNLTQSELVSPLDKEVVRDIQPMFNWLPPVPLPHGSNITYELTVVEILERQTAYYAMLSNPSRFNQSSIITPLYQYPLASRQFIPGNRYAWNVKTFVDGILVSESETWEFTYDVVTQNIEQTNDNIKKELEGEVGVSNYDHSEKFYNINPPLYESQYFASRDFENEFIKEKRSLLRKQSEHSFSQNFNNILSLSNQTDEKESNFNFRGSYSIIGQHSSRQSTGSDIPRNFGNLRFNPTLIAYGIPFTFNLYLDTKQENLKQNINSYALLFDPMILKDMAEQRSKDRKPVKGYLKALSYFETLGLGETYPDYSKYTLNGTKVTGANLEFNPGLFYFAASGLMNLDAIPGTNFSRKLLAGKIGIGGKDNSHFHFTVLKAWDNENSLSSSNITNDITPQENVLVGFEGKLNLLNDKLTFEGEAVGSMHTRDITSPDMESEDFPSFLKNILDPKISSSFDFMFTLKSSYEIEESQTKLSGEYTMVGPGFNSLGAPNVRKDNKGFKFKIEQGFLEKLIQFSVFMQRDENNVAPMNPLTSTYAKYGVNLKLNFKDLPYIILDFRPNSVYNDADADSLKIDNSTSIFSVITGFNDYNEDYVNSANLYVSTQNSSSFSGAGDYSIINFVLSDNLSFIMFPLSLTGSIGYTINSSDSNSNIVSLDFANSYTFFNIWNNRLGINYTIEEERNNKIRLYFTSSIPLWNFATLNFNAEKSFYREDIFRYGEYDDFLVRAIISKSW
ncbi:MAG: hypothetical protein ISS16_02340 [Ignavibacteria bacterium]|nr:hypothetical protein [Ignavibacteria bacterium]